MEKTVLNISNEWKDDLNNENKNQSAQADKTQDHTSEDMDFEVVSVSSSEGEIVKRSRSYEEAINLENSSDFCNGQLTEITTELNSSSLNSELQQHGENPGIQEMMDSMDIVEYPSDGSMEPVLLEEGKNGSGKNEKVANSQIKTLNIPKDYIGTGDNISTSEVNASQGNINESGDAPSGTRSSKSLSTKDVEKPPDTPGQNKEKEGEIQDTSSQNEVAEYETQDSGTPSTENTVYKPSWSQDGGREQQVNEDSIKLDERKRKSPEKENVDQSKNQHLSKDPSKGGDTKGKDGVKFKAEVKEEDSVVKDKSKVGEVLDGKGQDEEEGEGDEEEQGENDEEQEEDSSSESDDEKTSQNEQKDGVKKKKHHGTRKKKKLEYQRKKNLLPLKPTDNKTPVSQEEGGEDEEKQRKKDEEQEEDTSSESDEGKTSENEQKDGVKKKKRHGTKKKKKLEYQKKKKQLLMKSTDNKTPVSQNADNDGLEDSKDKKEDEKEKKSDQNRQLRSHTSKEKDAANVECTKPKGNIGTNNNGSGQPSSKGNSQPTEKSKPGRIVIPVQFEDGKSTVSLKPTCRCACRFVCVNWFLGKIDKVLLSIKILPTVINLRLVFCTR